LNERRVIDESSQIPFGEELRKEQIERIPMLLKLNDFCCCLRIVGCMHDILLSMGSMELFIHFHEHCVAYYDCTYTYKG